MSLPFKAFIHPSDQGLLAAMGELEAFRFKEPNRRTGVKTLQEISKFDLTPRQNEILKILSVSGEIMSISNILTQLKNIPHHELCEMILLD